MTALPPAFRKIPRDLSGRGFFLPEKSVLHSVIQQIAGLDERRKLLLALRPEIQEFAF